MTRGSVPVRRERRIMVKTDRSPEEIRAILEQLVELQELDREIIQARKQAAALPQKIKALDARLAEEEKVFEELAAQTTDTSKRRRQLEREMRDLEEEVERHKKRLMEVKTNKEYAAVNQEIGLLREKIDAIETEILEMIEAEEAHEKRVAHERERLEQLRSQVEKERQRIRERIAEKKEKIKRLAAERERQRTKIPADVLALYDRLFERHPGDVVVPAVRNHCGGCHINLVSQKMLEIRQMKRIVQCEGCLRIFSGEAES